MNADNKNFDFLMKEAYRLIDLGYYEDAIPHLQRCSGLKVGAIKRETILDNLGYCFLRLGWYEDAVKVYTQYLKIYPNDSDGRFFLASAYSSLKWTDEAIKELKTILASDPTDVLARHNMALCYREKGWLKEALEEIRKANEYAATCGNAEEKKIVRSSLGHMEEEIQEGDEDGTKETFFLLILLAIVMKRSRVRARRPPRE